MLDELLTNEWQEREAQRVNQIIDKECFDESLK